MLDVPLPGTAGQFRPVDHDTTFLEGTAMTMVNDLVNPNNGIALSHMSEVIGHIKQMPELAQFQWRAKSRWVNGAHTQTTFKDYTGAGGEQSHRKAFVYDTDHPELFQQSDEGVTPVEFLLHALAGCLTAGIASVAANRGVQLQEVTATLEADHDMQAVLGLAKGQRPGFSAVRVRFDVVGDATSEELAAIVERSRQVSAVFDILTNPTAVTVEIA